MINFKSTNKYCCESIAFIENYEKAVNDKTQTWVIHHRKETDLGLSVDELKEKEIYYNVPASELIFLTKSEHMRLHKTGKHKGENNPMYGKKQTEETRRKQSESHKGKPTHIKGKHRVYRDDGSYYMSF